MNKKALSLILLPVVLFLPLVAFAQLHSYGPSVSISYLLDRLLGNLWILFAGFAVIMFLYAGVMFLTAEGDATKLKTARAAFLWGLIGVLVGIISYSIISVVGNLFGL